MTNYKLVVEFHAENDDDAAAQVSNALSAFDDGYESFECVRRETPVMRSRKPGKSAAMEALAAHEAMTRRLAGEMRDR